MSRLLSETYLNSLPDPIPWVYEMDCIMGKYYVHNEILYKAKQNMKPCIYEPGSIGLDALWDVVNRT